MTFAAAVAADLNTPVDVLAVLAGHDHSRVRWAAVANPNCPGPIVAEAACASLTERVAAAGNPNVDVATLTVLAEDRDWIVRAVAAGNARLPAEVAARLATEGNREVRRVAAGNPNVDVTVLTRPVAVATHPNTSPDVLASLAGNRDVWVRAAAAGNVNTPVDVLKVLAADPSTEVRGAAARNPNTPPDVLVWLAGELHSPVVVVGVAANPGADVDLLAQLAGFAEPSVRAGVAGNPNVPFDVLAALAGDGDEEVRGPAGEAVAIRLAVPARLRPPDIAVLAQAWLAGQAGDGDDPQLWVAAIFAVTDAGRRAGHVLAFGPGWADEVAEFHNMYGNVFDPADAGARRGVSVRRRAPRPTRSPAR